MHIGLTTHTEIYIYITYISHHITIQIVRFLCPITCESVGRGHGDSHGGGIAGRTSQTIGEIHGGSQ